MHDPASYRIRLSAAILREPDGVLVVRESRYGQECVNFPGGLPQFGETMEQAMIREVREETGIDVVPTDIAFVVERKPERWGRATVELCFYARVIGGAVQTPRVGEINGIEWRNVDDPVVIALFPARPFAIGISKGKYAVEASDVRS
jgi:8-oxo-dGTP diphosphatase